MRWLFLPWLLCACLQAQQASIEGVAVDAVTRQPMAGVHIMLAEVQPESFGLSDEDMYGAVSRADGRFSIGDLKPGLYSLAARYNGYLRLPSKASKGPDGSTITLKPGDHIKDFTVEMTPHAVIIGHVLDQNGDPVQHVFVAAKPAGSSGQMPENMAMGRSDERGQFRIPLPPGKFYIQAIADGPAFHQSMMGPPEIRADGLVPPVYGATFYPGVLSKEKATAVELAPGQNVSGIDIHLASRRSVTIKGVVTGLPGKGEFGSLAFVSVSSSTNGGHFNSNRTNFTQPDGTFTITGLSPDTYRLTATSQTPDGPPLQSAPVEVQAEADETSITLSLVRGETLSGTVTIEGDAPGAALKEKLTVHVTSEAGSDEGKSAEADDRGAFHIENVFPNRLVVTVLPLPVNGYVKAVRMGGAESTDGIVDLSHGVAGVGIDITLSRKGGHVEGRVLGEDGNPATTPLAFVVLAASGEDPDEHNLKMVESGTFEYSGLRPGKYRLIALDPRQFPGRGDEGPGDLKALLASVPEFEVHENDRLIKDVKLLAAEDASARQ
jgi:carboxypeptidase family protein